MDSFGLYYKITNIFILQIYHNIINSFKKIEFNYIVIGKNCTMNGNKAMGWGGNTFFIAYLSGGVTFENCRFNASFSNF